jgi:hypothetical protein
LNRWGDFLLEPASIWSHMDEWIYRALSWVHTVRAKEATEPAFMFEQSNTDVACGNKLLNVDSRLTLLIRMWEFPQTTRRSACFCSFPQGSGYLLTVFKLSFRSLKSRVTSGIRHTAYERLLIIYNMNITGEVELTKQFDCIPTDWMTTSSLFQIYEVDFKTLISVESENSNSLFF